MASQNWILRGLRAIKWLSTAMAGAVAFLSLTVVAGWIWGPLNFLNIGQEKLAPMTALVVPLVFAFMLVIINQLEKLEIQLRALRQDSSGVVHGGITAVIGLIQSDLAPDQNRTQKIQVVGLHLGSAWDSILRGLLQRNETREYQLDLLCLDPEFIETDPFIPNAWADRARTSICSINEYVERNSSKLEERKIIIKLWTYDIFPAIHGFFHDTEALYIACLHWDLETRQVADPHTPYERFVHDDRSDRARFYRELFSNWRDRALQDAKAKVDSAYPQTDVSSS